jgi:hypothetical protein
MHVIKVWNIEHIKFIKTVFFLQLFSQLPKKVSPPGTLIISSSHVCTTDLVSTISELKIQLQEQSPIIT